jgi:hypothetical protein
VGYGGRGYRGDYGGGGYRGDGFLSKLGKGILRTAGTVVGGIVRSNPVVTAVTTAAGVARGFGGGAPQMPGGAMPQREGGITGMVHRVVPGGASGYVDSRGRPVRIRKDGKPYKRPSMNVLNGKAANRAIRRITGARHMLQAIERQMPHRKAAAPAGKRCGCK